MAELKEYVIISGELIDEDNGRKVIKSKGGRVMRSAEQVKAVKTAKLVTAEAYAKRLKAANEGVLNALKVGRADAKGDAPGADVAQLTADLASANETISLLEADKEQLEADLTLAAEAAVTVVEDAEARVTALESHISELKAANADLIATLEAADVDTTAEPASETGDATTATTEPDVQP